MEECNIFHKKWYHLSFPKFYSHLNYYSSVIITPKTQSNQLKEKFSLNFHRVYTQEILKLFLSAIKLDTLRFLGKNLKKCLVLFTHGGELREGTFLHLNI